MASDLFDGLESWVQVASTDEVACIEGINLAISLKVIDVKGEFDGVDFLLLESKLSHDVLCDVMSSPELTDIVKKNFDLRPGKIVKDLKLRTPIFQQTSTYGHFGRDMFTWEQPKE